MSLKLSVNQFYSTKFTVQFNSTKINFSTELGCIPEKVMAPHSSTFA